MVRFFFSLLICIGFSESTHALKNAIANKNATFLLKKKSYEIPSETYLITNEFKVKNLFFLARHGSRFPVSHKKYFKIIDALNNEMLSDNLTQEGKEFLSHIKKYVKKIIIISIN